MSDLISRQAAIDAIGGNKAVGDPSQMDEDEVIKMWERIRIINVLNHLPSAEPEKRTEERTETHSCDCISRQALLKQIDIGSDGEPGYYGDTWKFIDTIKNMPSALGTNLAEVGTDAISRQAAIDKLTEYGNGRAVFISVGEAVIRIEQLPPIQPEIIRCKDCQYWNKGSCECPEHAVNCQDYYVGDIETEAEHFCGYAERREVTNGN